MTSLGIPESGGVFGSWEHDETHLVVPPDVGYDTWADTCELIARIHHGSRWWLADALAYGERAYGETYAAVGDRIGFAPQTLANMVRVARAVPPSRRRSDVPFEHHAVVAPLEPPAQKKMLEKAATREWTRNELREAVRDVADHKVEPDAAEPAPRGICERCGAPTVTVVNPDGQEIVKYAH